MKKMLLLSPNLLVSSVEDSMKYYQEIFDFSEGPTVPGPSGKLQWGMVASGSVQLMFQTAASILEEIPDFPAESVGGSFSLFIETEDTPSLFEAVKDKVQVVIPLKKTFYGKWEFIIKDLNGYYVTFASDVK